MTAKDGGAEEDRGQGETGGVPRASDDPFERAARRERKQKLQEEVLARHAEEGSRWGLGGRSETGMALRTFLLPYLVWAAVRFLRFPFRGSLRESIYSFFFSDEPFAIATVAILFFTWVWLLEGGSRSRGAIKTE